MHSLMSLLGALDTIPGTEEQPEERSKEDVLYAEEFKDRIERNLTKCRNMTVDKSLLGNLLVQTNSRPSVGVNPICAFTATRREMPVTATQVL